MLAASDEDIICKGPSPPIASCADTIAQCGEKVGILFEM